MHLKPPIHLSRPSVDLEIPHMEQVFYNSTVRACVVTLNKLLVLAMVVPTHWTKTWIVLMVVFTLYPVHVLLNIPERPQQRFQRGSMNIFRRIRTRQCMIILDTAKLVKGWMIFPFSFWKMFTRGESTLCPKGNIYGIRDCGELLTSRKLLMS